ncbi:MAG: CHAP domain-containing protein [Planctomycetes bacterium]|nr:CHAP domain-containing protein [Planctomycetota bacterium]
MSISTISLFFTTLVFTGGPEQAAPHGFLNQPAYSLDRNVRPPVTPYRPQAGDVILFSDANVLWNVLYAIALTGAPGHTGLVVRMEDGRLGIIEAGYNETLWVRLNPLDERLPIYKGILWIRQRKTPVSETESRLLTEYAETINGRRYSVIRLLTQLTPFRTRGPIRTAFLAKPKGYRSTYICSESVLEALVHAGLINAETTRPSATFPRDLFFDQSPNPYINRHPPLACDWEAPAFWNRCNP